MIYKWSKFYAAIKLYMIFPHRLFYKTIIVNGKENIPKNTPLIFAPNHQNALMDPLAIIYTTKQQSVFLARADIFKSEGLTTRFLKKAKILPIYRIRDGANTLKKNEKIFDITVEILKNNKSLVLFPEARHNDKRYLLLLKKAIPRIAFKTMDTEGFDKDIKIVPVGIYYSNYSNIRTVLQINYGKPISMLEYYKIYLNNQHEATVSFTEELTKRLKPLMLDISNKVLYRMYEGLRTIYYEKMIKLLKLGKNNQRNKFTADKKIIDILDRYAENNFSELEKFKEKVVIYLKGVKDAKLRNWVFNKEKYSWFGMFINYLIILLLMPVHVYGIINNYLPYKIIDLIVKRKVKDIQFHSSFKIVIGIIAFPVYYLIMFFIITFITDIWWLRLAYVVSLPLSGLFAFEFMIWNRKIFAKLRYNILVLRKNKKIIKFKKLQKEIINKMDEIVKKIM